jgi:hypothetical protein
LRTVFQRENIIRVVKEGKGNFGGIDFREKTFAIKLPIVGEKVK